MRDPHYRKLLEGLARPVDPELFEECSVDLLRHVYSGLVPIHGGGDYGMDGAIADGEGAPYPLIVTTAEDVLRNLTKNLDAYVAGGGPRRRAVVATSTALTPLRRKHLEDRANEKGFILLQIHEQRDIAGRLSRDSRWTLDLLGITGELPALSSIPSSRRPLQENLDLVGRDADLEWLRTTRGDRVVVGQPGSGKTYLVLHLVRDDGALFLASDDEQRIAEACRDLEPTVIIVDDAHVELGSLDRLRGIRERIGASFDILATTWPGFEDEVRDALGGISNGQVHNLELLTRAQILEVLRGVGLQEPDDDSFLGQLVNQASNKPGLAVTLGSLSLRGEWPDVLTGRAISRSLIPALTRVLEDDPTQLLACFALGGDRGMRMRTVAEFLEVGLGELHRQAVRASQGGVLRVEDEDSLAIEPKLLRNPLLEEIFFPAPPQPGLPFRHLLTEATDPAAAVETLALSALLGVPVPRHELRDLVGELGGERAWQAFAALGEEESRWVLANYSGDSLAVIHPVLQNAPYAGIGRLLQLSDEAEVSGAKSLRPLKTLEQWLMEIDHRALRGLPALRRREIVIEVVEQILDGEGRRDAPLLAAFMALSPRLETSRKTAEGSAVVLRQGYLSMKVIPQMAELWSRVLSWIGTWTAELWRKMGTVIDEWASPTTLGRDLDDEPYRDVARRMVDDLGQRFYERPGLTQALGAWRVRLDMNRITPPDEDFQILFPVQEGWTPENWNDGYERHGLEAATLARDWAVRPAAEVAGVLYRYEQEAKVFLHESWLTSSSFYRALALEVADPQEWFQALADVELQPWYVPFLLERIIADEQPGWERLVQESLENERLASSVSLLIIKAEDVSRPLLEQALSAPELEPFHVGGACMRNEIPLNNLRRLLRHPREEISTVAAINEWLAEPKGTVRSSVDNDWQEAIRRSATLEGQPMQSTTHWLAEILAGDPHLAFGWTVNYLKTLHSADAWRFEKVLSSASNVMTTDQRTQLLQEVDSTSAYALGTALKVIVNRSAEVFQALLGVPSLSTQHLAPLRGDPPDASWIGLANRALEAGHSAKEIAEQSFLSTGARSGFGESHWKKWQVGFSEMARSEDPGIQAIGKHGLEVAESHLNASRAMRRNFELTGFFR